MLNYYRDFFKTIEQSDIGKAWPTFRLDVTELIESINHGDVPKWEAAINTFPTLVASNINTSKDAIRIGTPEDATDNERDVLKTGLLKLHPWRKGPLDFFGIYMDTEWKCEMRWDRLKDHVDLNGKKVLDLGAANGYYTWRIKGAGAKLAMGVETYLLSVMQFHAMNHYIKSQDVSVLPISMDTIPYDLHSFDVVFSMGVLYHRKDPQEHLRHIKSMLAPNGVCVLESIVIYDEEGDVLQPEDRYAKMNNVPYVPSVSTGKKWLEEAGFSQVDVVDVSETFAEKEQRSTEWMTFLSLNDFLDPNDPTKTVEGLPAPKRAVYIAQV